MKNLKHISFTQALQPIIIRPSMYCGSNPVTLLWFLDGIFHLEHAYNNFGFEIKGFLSKIKDFYDTDDILLLEELLQSFDDKQSVCEQLCKQAVILAREYETFK
jgi:hypothetical protein